MRSLLKVSEAIELSLDSTSHHRDGITAILIACLFTAVMGTAFFQAHVIDPTFSSFSGSFIRVAANFVFIAAPLLIRRAGQPVLLSPVKNKSLWLWGVFGALTVITYFSAINLIGSGLTSFLSAGSGVFIAALSPIIAGQRTKPRIWIGIIGAVVGMYLLCTKASFQGSVVGLTLAILSGLFAALAYLMIARTGSKYSTTTVMMTWCVSALTAHAVIFMLRPVSFPVSSQAWTLLIGAGIAASFAQHFTTLAFQRAPSALVASMSYLAPVLSMLIDCFIFRIVPGTSAVIGALVILTFGTILPLVKK